MGRKSEKKKKEREDICISIADLVCYTVELTEHCKVTIH